MSFQDMQLRAAGRICNVKIKDGQVKTKQGSGPLAGAHASLETVGQINSRFTATRLALAGPLALAFKKKKDQRELYLTIEGNGYYALLPIDPKQSKHAYQFVGLFNNAALQA
jgi:hypothetical protein